MPQKILSRKIKEYRINNNLSQEYMAIQMEISLQEYRKIENGAIDLKISKLDRLAKTLGTKKSTLVVEESFSSPEIS
jgi:transcriptional regulator with XRE-family HTH domain